MQGGRHGLYSAPRGSKNEEVHGSGELFRNLNELIAQPGAAADARGSLRPVSSAGAGAADLVSLASRKETC